MHTFKHSMYIAKGMFLGILATTVFFACVCKNRKHRRMFKNKAHQALHKMEHFVDHIPEMFN